MFTFKKFLFFQKIQKIIKKLRKESQLHKRVYEVFQLTSIYILGTLFFFYTIKSGVGYFPEYLYKIPYFEKMLESPFLKILSSPEKLFFIYLLIMELMINRPILRFSLLVKFNVLLIFIMEMFQNLILSSWELFNSRQMELIPHSTFASRFSTMVFSNTLVFFFLLIYFSSYLQGIKGYFPKFPNEILQKTSDSVAFWIRVKRVKKK